MKNTRAFSIYELVVVLIIIVVLFLILLPALISKTVRTPSHQLMNATKIRGIHWSLALYSDGNNGHYPGVMADGLTIDPAVGLTMQGRIDILIKQNYFDFEYTVSSRKLDARRSSFALLQVNVQPDGKTVAPGGRNDEWQNTKNASSVIVSDRAIATKNDEGGFHSIHGFQNSNSTGWRGSVGWNDNHVTFEKTNTLPTHYGETEHLSDNLFATPGDAHTGDDAFMVWSGTNQL